MTALIPASPTSRRTVLRAGAAAVLVGGLGTTVALRDAGSASAAAAGTCTVGSTPVALNTPSDPAVGRITPAADAATRGMFGAQVPWPVIPIHVAVGRNGHLTSWGTPVDTAAQGGTAYDDWDVAGVSPAPRTRRRRRCTTTTASATARPSCRTGASSWSGGTPRA